MGCSLDVYRAYVRSASSANDDSLIGVMEKPVVGDAEGRQYELAVAKGEDDKTQNAAAQLYASLGVGEDGEVDRANMSVVRRQLGLGADSPLPKSLTQRQIRAIVTGVDTAAANRLAEEIVQRNGALADWNSACQAAGVSFKDLQKKLEDVSAYRLSQLAGGDAWKVNVANLMETSFQALADVGKFTGRDLVSGDDKGAGKCRERMQKLEAASQRLSDLSDALGILLNSSAKRSTGPDAPGEASFLAAEVGLNETEIGLIETLQEVAQRTALELERLPDSMRALDERTRGAGGNPVAGLLDRRVSDILNQRADASAAAAVKARFAQINATVADLVNVPEDSVFVSDDPQAKTLFCHAQGLRDKIDDLVRLLSAGRLGFGADTLFQMLDRLGRTKAMLDGYLMAARQARLDDPQISRQYNSLSDEEKPMAGGAGYAKLLKRVFDGQLDCAAYLLLRKKNYPAEMIETGVTLQNELRSRELGEGSFNTATWRVESDLTGQQTIFVTKDVSTAKSSYVYKTLLDMDRNVMANMGFDVNNNDVAAANYLSRKMSESLGSEVIVRTKVGVFRTESDQGSKSLLQAEKTMSPRILMEMAEGKSASKVSAIIKNGLSSAEGPSEPSPARFFANGNKNQFWYSTGHLMKTLNELDWCDALTGQCDRHGSNMILGYDDRGKFQAKGIDNDMSFPQYRTGVAKFRLPSSIYADLSQHNTVPKEFVKEETVAGLKFYTIDLDARPSPGSKYTTADFNAFKKVIRDGFFNVKNMRKPHYITSEMLVRMKAMGEDYKKFKRQVEEKKVQIGTSDWKSLFLKSDFAKWLGPAVSLLSHPQLLSYSERFGEMHALALSLEAQGRVLDVGKLVPPDAPQEEPRDWSNVKSVFTALANEAAELPDPGVQADSAYAFFVSSGLLGKANEAL